jgi:hypothetical protein
MEAGNTKISFKRRCSWYNPIAKHLPKVLATADYVSLTGASERSVVKGVLGMGPVKEELP